MFEPPNHLSAQARDYFLDLRALDLSSLPSPGSSGGAEIRVLIGGLDVRIVSAIPTVIDGVRTRYSLESEDRPVLKAETIEVSMRGQDDREVQILSSHRYLVARLTGFRKAFFGLLDRRSLRILVGSWGGGPRGMLHALIDNEILNVYANWQDQVRILHGNAVGDDGSAVILSGGPGSGKTMLSMGLMARGARWLSDDFTGLEAGPLRIHPFPRRPRLRRSAMRALSALVASNDLRRLAIQIRGGFQPVPRSSASDHKAVAHTIVFLRGFGPSARLEPLVGGEAVRCLLENTLIHQEGADALAVTRSAFRILDGLDCLALTVGPCRQTIPLLEDLIRSAPRAS
jgi:hypothetical protein